ncbi:MAG: hypothetical protein ACI4KM_11960, partial [Oscillospiraceae bacterium]
MAVNKVVIDGVTAIDLTNDTVSADKLLKGITAHDSSGKQIVGTMGGDSLLPKPYALTDFWDFTQNVDTDRNSWKSLMSEKTITGSGVLTHSADYIQFSEQFICEYYPLFAFTVYAIIRAPEYVSGSYDLIATSYGNTPYFNVGSYNGTFDIITSPQAQQMLYTNVPAYGEWHVVAMTFEGTCNYGKGSLFLDGTVRNQFYNYYAPYPAPAEGAFYFAGQCKAIAICPDVAHGENIVAENSAFLQQ